MLHVALACEGPLLQYKGGDASGCQYGTVFHFRDLDLGKGLFGGGQHLGMAGEVVGDVWVVQ